MNFSPGPIGFCQVRLVLGNVDVFIYTAALTYPNEQDAVGLKTPYISAERG